jgi:hypothetical protein
MGKTYQSVCDTVSFDFPTKRELGLNHHKPVVTRGKKFPPRCAETDVTREPNSKDGSIDANNYGHLFYMVLYLGSCESILQ